MELETKYFRNRREWRKWLQGNYSTSPGIWLVRIKKGFDKPCVSYNDAVEEALCFGWIDGQIQRIDEEKFILRMTPRRPKSVWSKLNTDRVEKLIKEGLMTEAGMIKVEEAKKNGNWDNAYFSRGDFEIPPDLEKGLKKNKTAWQNFQKFSNSSRRIYVDWILRVKTETTRQKWIQKVVERSLLNKRPGEI